MVKVSCRLKKKTYLLSGVGVPLISHLTKIMFGVFCLIAGHFAVVHVFIDNKSINANWGFLNCSPDDTGDRGEAAENLGQS